MLHMSSLLCSKSWTGANPRKLKIQKLGLERNNDKLTRIFKATFMRINAVVSLTVLRFRNC